MYLTYKIKLNIIFLIKELNKYNIDFKNKYFKVIRKIIKI